MTAAPGPALPASSVCVKITGIAVEGGIVSAWPGLLPIARHPIPRKPAKAIDGANLTKEIIVTLPSLVRMTKKTSPGTYKNATQPFL
jgi:hypothetical protein